MKWWLVEGVRPVPGVVVEKPSLGESVTELCVCVCVILSTLAAGWGPSGVFRRVTPSVVALFWLE